jgi:dTDP-4-amino-4,6-dideoxygalactose transaminase
MLISPLEYDKQLLDFMMEKHNCNDPWDVVDVFEKTVANYAGSKYGVAVDNCTDAMFLCLKYLKAEGEVTVPRRTYVSVPCTIIHAGCTVKFDDIEWSGAYALDPFPVYDSATRMTKGMYVPGSYYCLSFHRRKHVPIGKGGMILTDDKEAYEWFKSVRYEGRHLDRLYKDDYFENIGWNMYMPPEQAARGLFLFDEIEDVNEDLESSGIHKDLSVFPIYEKANR